MFEHILIPTDLTDRSRRSLDVAIGMAARFGARATLLHVIETIPGATFAELDEFYRRLEERARTMMAEEVTRIGMAEVAVVQQVVYGRRAAEILRFVNDESVDLVVLASHALEPTGVEGGLGAISYRVGLMARCPVLLVR